ncbi:MAG: type II toxin-antitoxin system VapC family toxin [Candidatus Omnitrophica bacterium]|nr:type II toxin-antitoxin system VapC family toxin [Candidatus Omnitrophota bacterium]
MAKYLSVITECELLSSPVLTPREERSVVELLELFSRVAITSRIARLAAQLRLRHSITIPDALIAATALMSHATLLTRNVKDFRAIRTLHIQSL